MGRALPVWEGLAPHGRDGVALASSPVVLAKIATPDAAASLGDFPDRRADLHGMRRAFPDQWGLLLRKHFHNATHVAAFFDVDHRTARDWLSGKHGATAPVALYAIQRIPGALAMLTQWDAA